MSISPKERAATLAGVVGEGCKGKRAFYQGSGTSPITKKDIAIWNVECTNGKSYVIEVRPDGSGGVLECSVLAAMNGGKCFKKF